jgi:prolyl-tRNA editing enzyme YbaK/EbsC (Cys-tRNA(Pro) deacylase)
MRVTDRLEKTNIDFKAVSFDGDNRLSDALPTGTWPQQDESQSFIIKADGRYYLCVIPQQAPIELQLFKGLLKAEQISLISLDELDSLLADAGDGSECSHEHLTEIPVWDEPSACSSEYVIIPIGQPDRSQNSDMTDFEPVASGD